jgi:hypothetical protein
MTTIIGEQLTGGCQIYADTRTIDGQYRPWDTKAMPKAIERAEYLLAASGSGDLCEYVLHAFRLPMPPSHPSKDYSFMCGDFVPMLRRALREDFDFAWSGEDPGKRSLTVLVALRGRLYQLAEDGTVCTGLYSYGIGSGAAYALGAIATGATVEAAMEAAALLDANTGRDHITLIQKGDPRGLVH